MGARPLPAEASTGEATWPPPQGAWTYDDYARLPDNGMRYEVIDGELLMSPAPRTKHQRCLGDLYTILRALGQGAVYFAPVDVVFEGAAPVQPDLIFISSERAEIVKETRVEGVPDLVVEVLSPSDPGQDRRRKFALYAKAGVREYWMADPDEGVLEIWVLRGTAYALLGAFRRGETARSEVLPGLSFDARQVFPA